MKVESSIFIATQTGKRSLVNALTLKLWALARTTAIFRALNVPSSATRLWKQYNIIATHQLLRCLLRCFSFHLLCEYSPKTSIPQG